MKRVPIFAANWKMNKKVADCADFAARLSSELSTAPGKVGQDYEVVIAPPATHLMTLHRALSGTGFRLGAQNGGSAKSGAFTGEVSPEVLKEVGVDVVIVGHSERRHLFKEDNVLILARCRAALEEGLRVMLCVGEQLKERKEGKTFATIEAQLAILKDSQFAFPWERLSVAYEPVWAIGTGENATPAQAQEVHLFIRGWFAEKVDPTHAAAMRVLYGGSAKPENSAAIMAEKDVDGLLVGGASLDPGIFAALIKNGLKSRT